MTASKWPRWAQTRRAEFDLKAVGRGRRRPVKHRLHRQDQISQPKACNCAFDSVVTFCLGCLCRLRDAPDFARIHLNRGPRVGLRPHTTPGCPAGAGMLRGTSSLAHFKRFSDHLWRCGHMCGFVVPGQFLVCSLDRLGQHPRLLERSQIVAGRFSASGFRLATHFALLLTADRLSAVAPLSKPLDQGCQILPR